jgi:hypothetical protein
VLVLAARELRWDTLGGSERAYVPVAGPPDGGICSQGWPPEATGGRGIMQDENPLSLGALANHFRMFGAAGQSEAGDGLA